MKNLVLVLLLLLCFDLSAQSDAYKIIKPSVASVKATKGETVHIIYRVRCLNKWMINQGFPHQIKNLELKGWKLKDVKMSRTRHEIMFDIVVIQIAERTSQCALKGILYCDIEDETGHIKEHIKEKIILKM